MLQKIIQAPTHHGFNLWFLYELKQDFSHKFVWNFPFYYFCSTKSIDCLTLREHQPKTVNLFKNGKFVMKIFFQIILNKVVNPQCWHFCKWIKWWFVYIKSINGLSSEKWALTLTQANKPESSIVEKLRRFLIVHYVLITTLSWKPMSKTPWQISWCLKGM